MNARAIRWAICIGLLGLSLPPRNAAAGWFDFCGYGSSVYVRDYVPYFAMHPPVYYSYPLYRPYGFSPFALPPLPLAAEIRPAQPVMIQNVYVDGRSGTAGADSQPAPLVIKNPYVAQ